MTTETIQQDAVKTAIGSLFQAIGFEPTPEQDQILDCRNRFILVTGGEQAGKSLLAAKYLLSRLPESKQKAIYWLVAADYERTRREFEYLAEDFSSLGMLKSATKRIDPGHIELVDGTIIKTKSAKDPTTLAMEAPDGIVGCEAGMLDLETYWRLRGRTGPKRSWLFLCGTLENSIGWYAALADSWRYGTAESERSFRLPTWTNKYLYPGGRQDPEILRMERDQSDEWFMERMGGIPSPPKGAVFANYFRPDIHIVSDLDWDPDVPVRLWIDPGYAGAYAIEVVQVVADQVRVFDEIYVQNLVTTEIISLARQKPWWDGAKMAPGVVDVAGFQHQAMPAVAEIWLKEANYSLSANRVGINEGSERLKTFLRPNPITGAPKIVFSPKCRGILSEFGAMPNPFDGTTKMYRWKTDHDGNLVGNTPEDKYNHGIKAVIYGLVDQFGHANVGNRDKILVKRW